MKGAREYAGLFETGQYGKLYITSSEHARGKTFHIQVLPDGEKAKPNGRSNPCLNDNAVEVYGIISGQPGWTEVYGWLHKGKWQDDFNKLVAEKQKEKMTKKQREDLSKQKKKLAAQMRSKDLLANY